MAFIPCTLTIEGHGSLLPEERHKIYAPVAGIVGEVPVDHDERVNKGDIVVKLDSCELQKELKGLIADKQKAESQFVSLGMQVKKLQSGQDDQELLQIQAQRAEAKITAKSSKERIEILKEQIESMNVRSPQDGIITTWEARKNLMGRPVEIGTELLQVAATDGDWILEVEVPDDDMGPILAAQSKLEADIKDGRKKAGTPLPAYFVTMTDPEHRYEGYVVRIAPGAETMAESEQYKNRHIVKVTVGFSEAVRQDYLARNQIKEMRPGAEVRRGSTAAGPTWPITCFASRSRSSTNRCCSAGRSCIERSHSISSSRLDFEYVDSLYKPGPARQHPGGEEARSNHVISKPIAVLAAGCLLLASAAHWPRAGGQRQRAGNPGVQALVLEELARIDWIEKSDVAALREGVIEKMELQIGMPVKKNGVIGVLHREIAELTVRKNKLQAKAIAPEEKAKAQKDVAALGRAPATSGSTNRSRAWSPPKTSPRPRASSRSPRPSIHEAEENRGIAEAELDLAKRILEEHTIVAPFDGVIIKRMKTRARASAPTRRSSSSATSTSCAPTPTFLSTSRFGSRRARSSRSSRASEAREEASRWRSRRSDSGARSRSSIPRSSRWPRRRSGSGPSSRTRATFGRE